MLAEFIGNNILLFVSFALFSILLISVEIIKNKHKIATISSAEAINLMNNKNAVLIDTRPVSDFQNKHIIGAIHMSANDVEKNISILEKYRDKPVITYCQAGMISKTVAKELQNKGFSILYSLKDGILGWEAMNLPTGKK